MAGERKDIKLDVPWRDFLGRVVRRLKIPGSNNSSQQIHCPELFSWRVLAL
jgi:hypothetical protein